MSYEDRIAALPKPHTKEEQYMYSLICNIAGVAHPEPPQNPFWRMEQYWKAFAEIAEARVNAPVVPSENTVGTDELKEGAVVADKIKDKTITLIKLAEKITEDVLHEDVIAKLLDEGSVHTEHIADGSVTMAKLGDDISFDYDEEITDESTNAPQTKAVKAYVDGLFNEIEDVTEVGL